LGADSELSVKNGAELLDRLIKDIVSESAATYVSILHTTEDGGVDSDQDATESSIQLPMAFSLARFIPLLKERIFVLNPFTRTFLVGWITLLDSIPDLELVTYLPEFLGGLFKFLSDPNRDVHVATSGALERFLSEIKRISRIKKGIQDSRKSRSRSDGGKRKRSDSTDSESGLDEFDNEEEEGSLAANEEKVASSDDDWIPGQEVAINFNEILEILTQNLDSQFGKLCSKNYVGWHTNICVEEDSLLESLRWIVEFLDICPEEVLPFAPKVLAHLLPAMASSVESIRQAAARVNTALMDYVVSLSDEASSESTSIAPLTSRNSTSTAREAGDNDRSLSNSTNRGSLTGSKELEAKRFPDATSQAPTGRSITSPSPNKQITVDLDYAAAVNSLTLLFLNDHEATRVAALTWLLMLHRKAPRKVLAFNDGTFPALLKTLSDPAEAVVTRDLQLLSQISRNSEDDYFTSFMVNLLQLFSTDRKLLETRGNLIIRQLCKNLSAERIYRTLADCIEKEEDIEFASIMVQNLNNNLITAPELADLRKRLRNLETRVISPITSTLKLYSS
jgi:vacuole morphology and inheritance protein 14